MSIKVLEIDLIKVAEYNDGLVNNYYNYNHFMFEYRGEERLDKIETVYPIISYYKDKYNCDYIKPIGYDCIIRVNLSHDLDKGVYFATSIIDIMYCNETTYKSMLEANILKPNNITKNIKTLYEL